MGDRPEPRASGGSRREYVTVADAEVVRGHLMQCRTTSATGRFVFFADEPEGPGGGASAPTPMAYFVGGFAFSMLHQIARCSREMKIPVKDARVRATAHFSTRGSIAAETAEAMWDRVHLEIELDSDATEVELQRLLRVAKNVCFTARALPDPVTVTHTAIWKGGEIDVPD
jgi:uncharacterized OsmC-like protein